MLFCRNPFQSHREYWGEFSLHGIKTEISKPPQDAFPHGPDYIRPYLWGKGWKRRLEYIWKRCRKGSPASVPSGILEARALVGHGTTAELEALSLEVHQIMNAVFAETCNSPETATPSADGHSSSKEKSFSETAISSADANSSSKEISPGLVTLRLSPDLQQWKEAQHAIGNILPPKGSGLAQCPGVVLHLLGATTWPEAMKTNDAVFGCGVTDLLIGAADAPTLFSNYVNDMAFYYEHGYHRVFPSLGPLIQKSLEDRCAMATPGGRRRREAVQIGKRYIQAKISLEEQNVEHLTNRSARLNRRAVQIVSLFESSLLGMGAEAMAHGIDPGVVASDLIFSAPGTDVIDVGSDLVNSEVMNTLLNAADVTETGIVSEAALRRVYDALAAVGARVWTEWWWQPLSRMIGELYTWHMTNDRHLLLRRAILGWPKARKTAAAPPREADFDEVFDEDYRTTRYSRPLDPKYVCNGSDTCDHVDNLVGRSAEGPLLQHLWQALVVGPLEYVRGGQVDERREEELVHAVRMRVAEVYSKGLLLELVWVNAHASHHAWQVNYLYEAAMFGSILDGGALAGKLDRSEGK